MKGHEFVKRDDVMMTSKHMCDNFIDHMEKVFSDGNQEKDLQFINARG